MAPWLALLLALLVVCWATGARQRLMWLRSRVATAFAPVGETGQRLASLVLALAEAEPEPSTTQSSAPHSARAVNDPVAPNNVGRASLRGALLQYVAALATAQNQPLAPVAIDALSAAQQLLWALWQEQLASQRPATVADNQPADPTETVPPELDAGPTPRLFIHQWLQAEGQYRLVVNQFNVAVHDHNAAVRQFPARPLAFLMGYESAAALVLAPSLTNSSHMLT